MNRDLVIFDTSNYKILEESKDNDELKSIASKNGIVLPNHDLSIFKCIFAFVDRENLNGCTLTKAEAIKALPTLKGKAVDFDHIRKETVGHWLEASLEGDTIIAYGVFFKGNHEQAYEHLQEIISKSALGVSFEAWGVKEYSSDRSYKLIDPEFAGGALLPRTQPAYPGAKVLAMANDREKTVKELHQNSFSIFDIDTILRVCAEAGTPKGEDEHGFFDIEMIDFSNCMVRARYWPGDNRYMFNLKPSVKKITTASQYVDKIEKIEEVKQENLVKSETEENNKMDEKIKELETKVSALEVSLAEKVKENETLSAKVADAEKAVEAEKASKVSAIEEAKVAATKVAERRSELGEFAKDMSEEALLNDDKYENAKLKKEVAELKVAGKGKEKVTEVASVAAPATEMSTGTKTEKVDFIVSKRKSIQDLAFSGEDLGEDSEV